MREWKWENGNGRWEIFSDLDQIHKKTTNKKAKKQKSKEQRAVFDVGCCLRGLLFGSGNGRMEMGDGKFFLI